MSDFENIGWDKAYEYLSGQHDPNGANMDAPTPNLPYRLAAEINEHVVREASMTDYHLGRHERDDIALDYTYHLIDQNAVDDHTVAFNGLFLWRRIYGGGLDGLDG